MPLVRVPDLLRAAFTSRRPRCGPGRRTTLRVEPLEGRSVPAALTVTAAGPADLPADVRVVWVRALEDGAYDRVTVEGLTRAGLDRLLDALRWPGPVLVDEPTLAPPAVPPPPVVVPGGDPSPDPLPPQEPGGLTLTLFRPGRPPPAGQPPPAAPSRGGPAPIAPAPATPPDAAGTPAPAIQPAWERGQPMGPVAAPTPLPRDVTSSPSGAAARADEPGPSAAADAPVLSPARVPSAASPTRAAADDPAGASDAALLRRFGGTGDQPAFTELVRRHEASVLSVSARVLGDADLARDAAQATFLALARRAGVLDDRGPLAGWLYRVAYRMALRARRAAARRRRAELAAPPGDAEDTLAAVDRADVLRVLREEFGRLPDRYRIPLGLCYLDGRTHEEVARAAGLPRGSVAKRLAEGLDRLRDRLAHRGVVL